MGGAGRRRGRREMGLRIPGGRSSLRIGWGALKGGMELQSIFNSVALCSGTVARRQHPVHRMRTFTHTGVKWRAAFAACTALVL